MSRHHPILMPPRLKAGDKVRFVSPASTPDRPAPPNSNEDSGQDKDR